MLRSKAATTASASLPPSGMTKTVATLRSGDIRTSGTRDHHALEHRIVDLALEQDVGQRMAHQFADAKLALGGGGCAIGFLGHDGSCC